jgi:hypothetical protein
MFTLSRQTKIHLLEVTKQCTTACEELEDVLPAAGPGTRALTSAVMSLARTPTHSRRTLALALRRTLATEL